MSDEDKKSIGGVRAQNGNFTAPTDSVKPTRGKKSMLAREKILNLRQALLDNCSKDLIKQATVLVKEGNVDMIKFLLKQILPVTKLEDYHDVNLPDRLNSHDQILGALGGVMKAVNEDRISISAAANLVKLVDSHTQVIDKKEISDKLDEINRRLGIKKK